MKRITSPFASKIEIKQHKGVTDIMIDVPDSGFKQPFLLSSDRHHDSIGCARKTEDAHLRKIQDAGGFVLDFGDIFNATGGRSDPRRSEDDIRPEDKSGKYFDSIVDHAYEDYKPYGKNWLLMGYGNHETAVLKNANTDLIQRLVYGLRQGGSPVEAGGYGGWVRFMFTVHKTRRSSKRLKYFHGSGGESGTTFGAGQIRRQASYLRDWDILVNGHSHHGYVIPLVQEGLNDAGVVTTSTAWAIRTMTYEDSYRDGSKGWAIEKGHMPKPVGCVWGEFSFERNTGIHVTFTQLERGDNAHN